MLTGMLNNYTSTGQKFWCWNKQMEAYRQNDPRTVISTHVSPEGYCNLNCPYCSVSKRTKHGRIPFGLIKGYITELIKYGLKAVILTGGGEPLFYPEIDELIMWLKHKQLKIGLITNGTVSKHLTDLAWSKLSWVRVSLSVFDEWEQRIGLPLKALAEDCVVGCSFVYMRQDPLVFNAVSQVADNLGAEYIRLLPNCLLPQAKLEQVHQELEGVTTQLRSKDQRYFHQWKLHRAPDASVCHQSYFRPYLSEEPYWENGLSGSVYPCDSVVLNDAAKKFKKRFQLCYATDVGKFLEGRIEPGFDPRKNCKGCVFTDTVEMLGRWKADGQIVEVDEKNILHKEFV